MLDLYRIGINPLDDECHSSPFILAALMDGRWKAIRTGSRAAPLELFDLREDPAEANNVAASHPEVFAKLEAYLKTAREDSPDWPLFK